MTESNASAPQPQRVFKLRRFAIVAAILAVADACVLVPLWTSQDTIRQWQLILSFLVFLLSFLILSTAAILCTPWKWSRRLQALAALLAMLILPWTLWRIEGVDGDMIPRLSFRWSSPALQPSPSPAPPAAIPTAPQPAATQAPAVQSSPTTASKAQPAATSTDYPRFLGPAGDGIIPNVHLDTDWKSHPPRTLWTKPVGSAWSAFAVRSSLAVTQEQHDQEERVVAYDLTTGKLIWSHSDNARHETTLGGLGPRATPTLSPTHAYTLGATGILNCLELSTGKRIWSLPLQDEAHPGSDWGCSGSPLLLGDTLWVNTGRNAGPSLACVDAASGKLRFVTGDDPAGYATPIATSLASREQIIAFNHTSIAAHDPANGKLLWRFPWPGSLPKCAQPIVLPGDRIFLSSSYGVGCALLQIQCDASGQLSANSLWKNLNVKSKFSTMVARGQHVYALDDGILTCLDLSTGQRAWKSGRYGHGQILLAGDVLLITAESGDVVLCEASPAGHRELARLSVLPGKLWNTAALAGNLLLVRNDTQAVCLELPVKQAQPN